MECSSTFWNNTLGGTTTDLEIFRKEKKFVREVRSIQKKYPKTPEPCSEEQRNGVKYLEEYLKEEKESNRRQQFSFLVSKQGHVWIDYVILDIKDIKDDRIIIEIPRFVWGFKCNDKTAGSLIAQRSLRKKSWKILYDGFDEETESCQEKLSGNARLFSGIYYLREFVVVAHKDQPLHGDLDFVFNGVSASSIVLKDFNTTQITSMWNTFANTYNLKEIDFGGMDTSNVQIMTGCFLQSNMTEWDLTGWDTRSLVDISYGFYHNKDVKKINLSGWNVEKLRNIESLFAQTYKVQEINTDGWKTSSLENISNVFENSMIERLRVKHWQTGKVTQAAGAFSFLRKITTLKDIEEWDTSNMENISEMFVECEKLKRIDLSRWNTGKVRNAKYLFNECKALKEVNLSGWDVRHVHTAKGMFQGCTELKELDLSTWKTEGIANMAAFCAEATKLKRIIFGPEFYIGETQNLNEAFEECKSLVELDISSWHTYNFPRMYRMFYQCNHKAMIRTRDVGIVDRFIHDINQ